MGWFRKWRENRRVSSKVRGLNRQIDRFRDELVVIDRRRKRNLRDLKSRTRELDLVKKAVEEAESRLRETINEAKAVYKRYEEQLEGARSSLKIMEDVTVPTLFQQNRKLLEMWKAETSIEIMKQVASQPPNRDDME